MKVIFVFFLVLLITLTRSCSSPECLYMQERANLVKQDESISFDAHVVLNHHERTVSNFLASLVEKEIEQYGENSRFITTKIFTDIKDTIENSPLFNILSSMPKGGILHSHGIGDTKELIKMATYRNDCWINTGQNSGDIPQYGFSYLQTKPYEPSGVKWQKVVDLRKQSSNVTQFDYNLWKNTQFFRPSFETSEKAMWDYFDRTIKIGTSMASEESIWRNWVRSSLMKLVEDGITHIEFRGFCNFIATNGTKVYTSAQAVRLYLDVLDEVNSGLKPHQRITMRNIFTVGRTIPVDAMYSKLVDYVDTFMMNASLSKQVVGFDIVDSEDVYHTLVFYLKAWLNIKDYIASKNLTQPIKYFFHSGETEWDRLGDANLYDAILLNTTRIGHGFALKNYPYLMEIVKKKQIAIEVCPISNQMLRLLDDIRDHPAVSLLQHGVPVVISNDDPIVFGNHGLSYDYWVSFISWNLTLSGLKQLTQNSIRYSALEPHLKKEKLHFLEQSWHVWIKSIIKQYSLKN